MTSSREILELLEETTPPTIRKMLYRIAYLLVLRIELRVEAKTKDVFRKGMSHHDAVRIKH